MTTFLPQETMAELKAGQQQAELKKSRLAVHVSETDIYRVLALTNDAFTVPGSVPHLRGHVSLFDGPRHLADCLIICSEQSGDSRRYEFKRKTEASGVAPRDYVEDQAPVAGLISAR